MHFLTRISKALPHTGIGPVRDIRTITVIATTTSRFITAFGTLETIRCPHSQADLWKATALPSAKNSKPVIQTFTKQSQSEYLGAMRWVKSILISGIQQQSKQEGVYVD